MKYSFNWISHLLDGSGADPVEIGRLLTMKTAECEGVETFGDHLEPVCVARVVSVEPMGSGQNRIVVADTGRYGSQTVVCGAPNCRPGVMTAYMPPGALVEGKPVGRLTIGGVESNGMLASGAELGVSRDTAGIVELDDGGAPGDPLPGCARDHVIEIENKSITHRPDLWGHLGMAREIAAIIGRGLRDPVPADGLTGGAAGIAVEIEDTALCPRYSALVLENVTVRPSPLWLQFRLQSIGLNPINNIVDVTNWVMAEIAQPMHAFDTDTLTGGIIVRRARDGETVAALNDESYTLNPAHLVIADHRGAVAIAGVIGGLPTSITGKTTRVVLESANFHAGSIRRTSTRLKLRTDASMRFEKAQDPANTVRGLARAIEMIERVSPGVRVAGGLADAGRPPAATPEIELPLDWLERKLGRPVEDPEVRRILEALGFGVRESANRSFIVLVPSWRATKDISIKDDLAEEAGRLLGYGSITPTPPALPLAVPPASEERELHHHVRAVCTAQGFTESYNYSFLSDEAARRLHLDPRSHVAVLNPNASDQVLLRMSLVPGLVRNVDENRRHFDSFRLFEIGQEIHKQGDALPRETPHVTAVIYSRDGDGAEGLFECKRLAECLMAGAEVEPAEALPHEHPSRSYRVQWRGRTTGRIAELHPDVVTGRAAVLDVDLQVLMELGPLPKSHRPLRRFPSSSFDLSVVAAERDVVGDIRRRLVEHAGGDLESIEFVRVYSGPPLAEGRKSVSFRLTVCASDRTFSSEEVGAIRTRIIEGMRSEGYELRV
ncbi:MAG: phenylalanine--tRNA ligase subunit beta [Bryobacteraceae bacterium]